MRIVMFWAFLMIFIGLDAQQDYQWMVRDGKGRVDENYSTNITGDKVSIGLLKQQGTDNNLKCNDFFAIYDNGDYHLTNWEVPCDLPISPLSDFGYYNLIKPAGQKALYVYLTNRYEDDEPPESIDVRNLPPSVSPFQIFNEDLIISSPATNVITNHNLVDDKDITFIIPGHKGNDRCGYKLTYPIVLTPDLVFRPSSLDGGGPWGASHNSIEGTNPEAYSFNANELDLPFSPDNRFINFRAEVDVSLIEEVIPFTLIPDDKCRETTPINFDISVSDEFHDPNFIELKCVWEDENGDKFGIYHVECFNDGSGSVPLVTLEAILPTGASLVELLDWSSCCKVGCGAGPNKLTNLTIGEHVKVEFPVGLKKYGEGKTCKNTAWFEFKVQFLSSTNLLFADLSTTSPMSYFDVIPYNISTFYDHWTCYNPNSQIFNDHLDNATFDLELNCVPGREIKNCDYQCESLSCWQKIKNLFCCCKKVKVGDNPTPTPYPKKTKKN